MILKVSDPLKKSELLPTYNGYIEKLIKNMREKSEMAREKLIVSKQKSKNYYDRFTNPIQFDEGDKEWLIKEVICVNLKKIIIKALSIY